MVVRWRHPRLTSRVSADLPVALPLVRQHLDVWHNDDNDLITGLVLAAVSYLEGVTGLIIPLSNLQWQLPCWPSVILKPPFDSWTSIAYRDSQDVTRYLAKTYTIDADTVAGDVDLSTDQITITAHGLIEGQKLTYGQSSGTQLAPLIDGTAYYVLVVDENTIQLALTDGGAAIDLTAGPSASEPQTLTLEASDTIVVISDGRTPSIIEHLTDWPSLSSRPDAVTMDWIAGHSTLPQDVIQAIISLTRHWYDQPDSAGNAQTLPFSLNCLINRLTVGSYATDLP